MFSVPPHYLAADALIAATNHCPVILSSVFRRQADSQGCLSIVRRSSGLEWCCPVMTGSKCKDVKADGRWARENFA